MREKRKQAATWQVRRGTDSRQPSRDPSTTALMSRSLNDLGIARNTSPLAFIKSQIVSAALLVIYT